MPAIIYYILDMDTNNKDEQFKTAMEYMKQCGFQIECDHFEFKRLTLNLGDASVEIHVQMLKNRRGYKECYAEIHFPWIYTRNSKIKSQMAIGKPTKTPSPEYVDEVLAIARKLRETVMTPILNAEATIAAAIQSSKTIKG